MIVLIPAYQPGGDLIDLVRRLAAHPVVVVDDGSGPRSAAVFEAVRRLGAEVITLKANHGKGYALKAGFTHIRDRYPGRDVVCADSDGQHRPQDIEAVARRVPVGGAAMVLGTRRFTGAVPARSRVGNVATGIVFRLVTGVRLGDTQTGLRAYPASMLPWLIEIGGDRFEYEQRVLLRAAREKLPIAEVEIATVYLRHNASSHFRPLRDSVRIYWRLLAFAASSLLAFGIDFAVLFSMLALTGSLPLSAIAARLISATVNYGVNRTYVFGGVQQRPGRLQPAVRYALLAALLFGCNLVLLEAFTMLTGSVVVAKVLTELTLFAASFTIQRFAVFPGRRPVPDLGPSDQDRRVVDPSATSRPRRSSTTAR